MKLDVPHGLRRLPPAPELCRTQDTANPSHKEHIYLYVLDVPFCFFLILDIADYIQLHSRQLDGGAETEGTASALGGASRAVIAQFGRGTLRLGSIPRD
jgi:hypothetical protein